MTNQVWRVIQGVMSLKARTPDLRTPGWFGLRKVKLMIRIQKCSPLWQYSENG